MPCFQRSKDDAGVYDLSLGINISIQCSTNKTIDGKPLPTGFIIFFCLMIKFISGAVALSTYPVLSKKKSRILRSLI